MLKAVQLRLPLWRSQFQHFLQLKLFLYCLLNKVTTDLNKDCAQTKIANLHQSGHMTLCIAEVQMHIGREIKYFFHV